MKLSSLSILIPAYNVEETIETVVRDAYAVGKTVTSRLEILILNDASTDKTATVLDVLKKTIKPLRIITHQKNQGYGKTIKELYVSASHEWLFSLPGDHQFDAKELLKLIPHTAQTDMILGWRVNRYDPPIRLVQSRVYNTLLDLLFHTRLHDVNTIRLMRKQVIEKIRLKTNSAFVDAELAIKAKRAHFHLREVAIAHRPRKTKGATGGKLLKTVLPTIVDIITFLPKR